MPKPKDLKSEFLIELAERRAYWQSKQGRQAAEFASAYERMMCVFTTPKDIKRKRDG